MPTWRQAENRALRFVSPMPCSAIQFEFINLAGGTIMSSDRHIRVLMYSHDTFGLGHLRRSREIAHALVDGIKQLNVMIVSGSSLAGAFDLKARVDFIKVPSVIKLYNGEYTSLSEHIDLSETLEMRRAIIRHTAAIFQPDIFIVDKEPRGLKGELEPTLEYLKEQNCQVVLGLRDVLDEPAVVAREWGNSGAIDWIDRYYDSVWVYGCEGFWNPLAGLDVGSPVTEKTKFVGFLARDEPAAKPGPHRELPDDFVLVTAGGGGDGAPLMRQVLQAHATARHDTPAKVLVLGPFMPNKDRQEIHELARRFRDVSVIDFDNNMERIIRKARAVISMGGYNAFCELISFDKRSLIVPRMVPRREQLIRAKRAADLDLVSVLDPVQADDPDLLNQAIDGVLQRALPSQAPRQIDLGGRRRICDIVGHVSGRELQFASEMEVAP